ALWAARARHHEAVRGGSQSDWPWEEWSRLAICTSQRLRDFRIARMFVRRRQRARTPRESKRDFISGSRAVVAEDRRPRQPPLPAARRCINLAQAARMRFFRYHPELRESAPLDRRQETLVDVDFSNGCVLTMKPPAGLSCLTSQVL